MTTCIADQLQPYTNCYGEWSPNNQEVFQELANGILKGLCLSYKHRVYTSHGVSYGTPPFFIGNFIELALGKHEERSSQFSQRIREVFCIS